jgi:hypothetical protein
MNQGLVLGRDKSILSSPQCPVWLWSPPGILSMDNWGSSPRDKVARITKLITYLHLVPRIRILGAVPPLPHICSLLGA